MANRTSKLLVAVAVVAAAGVGYYLHSASAQTAEPQLVQAPLNASRTVTPAFIMAVDDSGSMDFETLFPTNDGSAWWHSTNNSFIGLNRTDAAAPGVLNFNRGGAADATWKKYPYLFPFGDNSMPDRRKNAANTDDHFAIPPTVDYAWARSPDINKAYFDPLETYRPWVESDGRFLQGVAGIDPATGQVSRTSAPADPKRGSFRLNLTQDFAYTNAHANAKFTFYGGMKIPRYTRYKDAVCANGGAIANTNLDTTMDGDFKIAQADRNITENSSTSRCHVAVKYFPSVFYVLAGRAAAVAAAIGYNTGNVVNDGAVTPSGEALRRFEIRPENFASSGDYARTIDNFANWFSYYRKRHQAARAALTLAFDDQNMKVRAGYFTINNRNTVSMRQANVAADRALLYSSFFALDTSGGTPNKEAVVHMGEQFKRAYQAGVSPVQLSCQKNFGMLFTDGFSNNASASVGNVDGGDPVLFPAPLGDTMSNTMADIAAHYYKNPLGTSYPPAGGQLTVDAGCSAANPDPRLDCQTKPHMNFYGVTLGAQGLVYGSPGYEAQTEDPFANPPTWPTAFFDRHPSAVDDLWHATLNARGKFINAKSSGELVRAIGDVVSAVTRANNTSGSFAVSGARVGPDSFSVEPFYEAANNTDWYGMLTARSVTSSADGAVSYTTLWEAGAQLPAPGARVIKVGAPGTTVQPQVANFTVSGLQSIGINLATSLAPLCSGALAPAACTPTNLAALGVTAEQAVSYLRGDRVLEGTKLRARSGLLGDIVNSSPVVAAPIDDYGYRSLSDTTLATSYATYLEGKKAAGNRSVLVGANDGMFHVFDGATGVEKFAYIPTTAVGHLGNLLFPRDPAATAQNFDHRYYVDGRIAVSDVYMGGGWKTIAVVSAGAGGRSVFALDITNPGSVSVLWELSNLLVSNTAITSRIGHVLGKPVIVPFKEATGAVKWKAIFGNGYNSTLKRASLFVVDIETGSVATIDAVEAAPTDAPAYNGLSNVVVLDRFTREGTTVVNGNDGFADTVYGADLNGAVWKFSLLDNTVQLGGKPLFIARDGSGARQRITGGLEAAAGPGTAAMLYFGTGSFVFDGDGTSTAQQTLYGIIDRGAVISGRSDGLLSQSLGALSGIFRATTANAIAGNNKGWYLDLPAGHRMVGYPRVESGVIFFPVYEPSSLDTNPCLPSGTNWLYGLDALSGGAALKGVKVGSPTGTSPTGTAGAMKLETDGSSPVTDVKVMTMPRLSSADPDDLDTALAHRCSMVVQVAGAPPLYLPRPCGRQSWRQVR